MTVAQMTGMEDRNAIRRHLRQHRRMLTRGGRRDASLAVLSHLESAVRLRAGMRVALYIAVGGELDTQPIIDVARKRGCRIYVPIVYRSSRGLRFVPLQSPLRRNR